MKKFTFLMIATTMMATGSQVMGQLDGYNGGGVQLPAVQMARDAFYSSLTAYQVTQNHANYWQSMQPYHPNAALAATYFQISANYQYQSMVRLYAVWQGIEVTGYIGPMWDRVAEEAETCSQYACWYALAGASMTTSNVVGDPAFSAAVDSYNKVELLVEVLGAHGGDLF